jgi:hypothetical protein
VHTDRETYFEEPLRTYPEASGVGATASGLINLLGQTLAESIEADCTAVALADRIAAAARPNGWTGFPGLPADSYSKGRFETIIEEISR